jgi:hypothetical protein
MTRNTDKRRAGDVPAATDGTAVTATGAFDSCKAGALPLARRSLETAPSGESTMKRKGISTATYILKKLDGKPFGGIKGYLFLPNYDIEVKVFFSNNKLDHTGNIKMDDSQIFNLNLHELEMINTGFKYIETDLKVLEDLAKRDKLKEGAYFEES